MIAGGAGDPASRPLTRGERDFLLLNIYVQLRHGFPKRAEVLAEALHRLGDRSSEVLLAQAVLRFLDGCWSQALVVLDELDRVDPTERFGAYRLTEPQRMRRYLRSRCLFELSETVRSRDAIEAYLRHGEAGATDE